MFSKHRLEPHLLSTAAPPIVLAGILYTLQHTGLKAELQVRQSLISREEEVVFLVQEKFCH
jgi:hypothetical protein